MSLDFNKINRAAAFNPTTAFPLDARAYFESYESAVAAAALAKEAGDTTTVYYYGQTFVVVENNAANLYIVQPDNTLKGAGGKITVDENAFTLDANGALWLEGFAEATKGAQLVKGADGKLSWVLPDNTTVEGLNTTVETLKTDVLKLADILGAPTSDTTEASGLFKELETKANKSDVYTKKETDTAITTAVSNAAHLKRKIVENEDAILKYANEHNDAEQYIFMVPTGLQYDANKYYEYIVLKTIDTETETVRYSIEKIGSWDIDLTDYAKITDIAIKSVDNSTFVIDESGKLILNTLDIAQINGLQDSLDSKVESKEGFGLVSLTEINKLATINENAEENFIKEVDTNDFTVDASGKLILNNLDIVKINGLDNLLNDSETGIITRLESVETSVTNYGETIETVLSILNGVDGEDGLTTIINGLETQVSNLIETVENNTVAITGLNEQVSDINSTLAELNILTSTNSESIATLRNDVNDIQIVINGLDDSYVSKIVYETQFGDFSKLNHTVSENSTMVEEINNLMEALTWQAIPSVE